MPVITERMGTGIIGCSSRRYYAALVDGGKKKYFFHRSLPLSFMWISIHVITLFISNGVFLLSPQGLTLLELAAHLEGTDTKLRHKGLGKV